MFNEFIEFIEIDIGKKLTGQIADRYAFAAKEWLLPKAKALSLSLSLDLRSANRGENLKLFPPIAI